MNLAWIQVQSVFTGKPELVDVTDIKTVGHAHKPGESIIRFKSGGYVVCTDDFEKIKAWIIQITTNLKKAMPDDPV